ncbi:hypothetical protein [Streptomyces peucetius]|nr:hypothetical protein CGZ69_05235 [Streptomyces peucetius subsp. caesius ATCC 27952]
MNGAGNGSWTTSTAKKYVGGKSAYADGALKLNCTKTARAFATTASAAPDRSDASPALPLTRL